MTTSTIATPARIAPADAFWLRLVQVTLAVSLVPLVILAVTGTFLSTISEGDFRYTADYWYTGVGLPLALISVGHTLGVHRLQHGRDGRLGTIGVWANGLASAELFAQLAASVILGAEVRWGPAYPVCALLSFVGVALLAAGSWNTGLLPKWVLGAWPVVWIVGGFAAKGLTPLLLGAFFVVFAVILTRRVHARAGRAAQDPVSRG